MENKKNHIKIKHAQSENLKDAPQNRSSFYFQFGFFVFVFAFFCDGGQKILKL